MRKRMGQKRGRSGREQGYKKGGFAARQGQNLICQRTGVLGINNGRIRLYSAVRQCMRQVSSGVFAAQMQKRSLCDLIANERDQGNRIAIGRTGGETCYLGCLSCAPSHAERVSWQNHALRQKPPSRLRTGFRCQDDSAIGPVWQGWLKQMGLHQGRDDHGYLTYS